MFEKIKGYKTVVFFVIAILVGLANLLGFAEFQMDAAQSEWFAIIIAAGGLVLRILTNTGVFQNE